MKARLVTRLAFVTLVTFAAWGFQSVDAAENCWDDGKDIAETCMTEPQAPPYDHCETCVHFWCSDRAECEDHITCEEGNQECFQSCKAGGQFICSGG